MMNVKVEPETSSGQRSGQHSADFVAGPPGGLPRVHSVTDIVSPCDALGLERANMLNLTDRRDHGRDHG
jgi:hypothetical protein